LSLANCPTLNFRFNSIVPILNFLRRQYIKVKICTWKIEFEKWLITAPGRSTGV
jgi:hypothetical protein